MIIKQQNNIEKKYKAYFIWARWKEKYLKKQTKGYMEYLDVYFRLSINNTAT